MNNLKEQMKIDREIMKIFSLDAISHPIRNTSKGPLTLTLYSHKDDYEWVLDAVPVGKEEQKKLFILLTNGKTVN